MPTTGPTDGWAPGLVLPDFPCCAYFTSKGSRTFQWQWFGLVVLHRFAQFTCVQPEMRADQRFLNTNDPLWVLPSNVGDCGFQEDKYRSNESKKKKKTFQLVCTLHKTSPVESSMGNAFCASMSPCCDASARKEADTHFGLEKKSLASKNYILVSLKCCSVSASESSLASLSNLSCSSLRTVL